MPPVSPQLSCLVFQDSFGTICIFVKQKVIGWHGIGWGHVQITCTSLQAYNNASILALNLYRPYALLMPADSVRALKATVCVLQIDNIVTQMYVGLTLPPVTKWRHDIGFQSGTM